MAEQFGFLILNAPERIRQQERGWFGVRIEPGSASGPAALPPAAECVIVAAAGREGSQELLRLAHAQGCRALLEVSSAEEAVMAGELGFDGVVSRSPLDAPVPVWGAGGIGLHSAAAWYAGGAAGVVLDFADASWARLARQFRTVPALVHGLRDAIRRHVELAKKHARLEPLASAPPDTRVLDTLNDASVEALLAGGETSVVLSGVHDARSAAMAAVMVAPLAEKGVRIGILADAALALEAARSVGELAVPFASPRVEEVLPPPKPFNVAIVGMGCLLPKAPNVRAFWANILNKVDAITDIPKERFNVDLYYDPDRKAKDKIHSRWGGFLDAVPFDPMRYGIPPNALPSIDPLQLLALVTVDQALADAGYRDREFPRQRTSVILGLSGGLGDVGLQYAVRSMLPQFIAHPPEELLRELPEWTEDSFAGLLLNVAAGRVANRFDLGGVNFSVDAACASSLAAVYLAARELADHSSDMAIVGGVDTAQSPFGYLCFAKAQALSGRGRCRTFDETADGIAISEGVSMMVLKRLEDAERDGDRIYAVIQGVAGSSDGKGRSMTAPRLEGQILALQRAYARAGIRPSTVGLIEAHGTGTTLGDASELAAVDNVFLADGAAPVSCAIGSIKSMVGHTKSAAGVTGLMKVALSLYHQVLPPTLHVEKPNPKLLEPGTPMYLNTEAQPWIPPAGTPRRGGVSAFGFGGTNFHAVLEEFAGDLSDPADVAQTEEWPAELFVWGNATPAALAELSVAQGTLRELARKTLPNNPGLARLAIVATSVDDLRAKLTKAKAALENKQVLNDPQGIYLAFGPASGKVAFLFPGQGSQQTGMLRDLALYFPEFRSSLEQAEQVLAGRFPRKLSAYIYPPAAFSPEREKQQNLELTDTVVAQPALGVVEIALCHALERLGVRPDMTAGHSYGEYVALAAAGVISDSVLFDLSESRGRAIKDTTQEEAGTMAAVQADAEAITKALAGMEGITLANHNSPRQTVISGANDAVRAAIGKLEAAGLTARLIPVACAFHSPLMEAARGRFAESLARQTFSRPSAEVFSNTLGGPYPEEPREIAALLSSHLVRPVKFVDEIRAMYARGARVFVEVGPKGVLTGLARQILEGQAARFIQIDSDRSTPWAGLVQLLHALAQLAVEGVAVEPAQLLRGRAGRAEPEARETGWMVNGLRAFPRSRPPQVVQPIELVMPSALPVPAALPVPVPATVPVPVATYNGDAVMLQFQQLMKQILQTQTTIMTAYMQGGAPVPTPVAVPATITAPPPPAPIAVVPPPIASAAPAPAHRSFVEDLRRIAAERTGYPQEMLDLDAAIEADLGIDSIKRVEILTALQKLGTPEEQHSVQAVLTQLTSARTLREIADICTGAAPTRPIAPSPHRPLTPIAAPTSRDFIAELRTIAAERTGYPPEMLDLDAGIEADLGIDSIKRVEILTALQKLGTPADQERVQSVMEKLTSARTLREIADRITAVLGTATHKAEPSGPAPHVPRYILTATAQPRRQSKPQYFPGRVCLITDDETGIAAAVADELNRAGEHALLLRHSPDAAIDDGEVFGADLTDPAEIESLVAAIRQQQGRPIGAIIHLLPLRSSQPAAQSSFAEWRELLRLDVRSLYALARAAESDLKQTGRAGGALFAAVTARGGDFGLRPNASIPPTHFSVADFTKTLALEFSGVLCKVVDLDATDPIVILQKKLLEELTSPDDTLQVGLPGDRRLTVMPQVAPVDGPVVRPIQKDWVFLLTGGARGVTAEIARQLAERYQPTLILAAASPLPSGPEPADTAGITETARLKAALLARLRAASSASTTVKPAAVEAALQRLLKDREIGHTIEGLRRAGARVEYHSLDVRREDVFGELIDRIYREYGRLDVVIHGAGIIEDKLIRDKTPESFDRVVHTKADSAFLLSRKLRPESLQCLLFMSSVTAAFGNRGQADYAAANGAMNGLAINLAAQWPSRVVAMNWGPWAQSGMVSEEVRQQFLARGIQMIPLEGGAQAALREIEAGPRDEAVAALGEGPWGEVALPAGTPHVQVHAFRSQI
jgi:acyl transferase domain-containing protein/NAD(P)-dependent dehydrogenase (short-subunit alcohol dehydrogenase family)/acyl carrier protein